MSYRFELVGVPVVCDTAKEMKAAFVEFGVCVGHTTKPVLEDTAPKDTALKRKVGWSGPVAHGPETEAEDTDEEIAGQGSMPAWTKKDVEELASGLSADRRQLLLQAIDDEEMASEDFAKKHKLNYGGLGKRFASIRKMMPDLPGPVWLRGEKGATVVVVDDTFALVAPEVLGT